MLGCFSVPGILGLGLGFSGDVLSWDPFCILFWKSKGWCCSLAATPIHHVVSLPARAPQSGGNRIETLC